MPAEDSSDIILELQRPKVKRGKEHILLRVLHITKPTHKNRQPSQNSRSPKRRDSWRND